MENYSNLKKQPKSPKLAGFIPLIIIAIGLVLILLQFLSNAGVYLQSALPQVKHPDSYNFTEFDHLLHYYVQGNLLDYRALKSSTNLNNALNELSHTAPDKLNSNNQLTFWINTYNLLVIKNVVDHYPLRNVEILEESFSLHKYLVGGKPYSLKDIEALELKPRLTTNIECLFLLSGGASGYPPLLNHAITSETMSLDARTSTFNFINNQENVYYDPANNILYLSPFFQWHKSLFSYSDQRLITFINTYLSSNKKVPIGDNHLKIEYLSTFNWLLNDTNLINNQRNNRD